MRFLFRLDLSLHAGAGKKFGILILGTKHGPSHHSPTHTHDHGAGENSVRQWASTSVKKLLVWPVHMCARRWSLVYLPDRQSYLIERDRHGSLPNISTAGTTLASGADKRWPMKKVQMSPQSSLHTVVQLSERFYPNTIVKAVLVPSQTIVTNRLD